MAKEDTMEDLDDDAKEVLQNDPESLRLDELDTEDDHAEEYGRKVKKRISKEVSARKKIADELEHERNERVRIAAEREALAAEVAEARERLAKIEERDTTEYTARAESLKKRRDAALDDGDLSTYNQLNDELTDVRLALREKANAPAQQPARQAQPAQQQGPKLSRAAQDWVKNNDWLTKDEAKTLRAARIEQQLITEGYSVNDPMLYEELDQRLKGNNGAGNDAGALDTYVGVDDELDEDDPPARQPGGSSVAGVPRDQGSRRPGSRNAPLTTTDLRKMAKFGMDPDNPQHRAAWKARNNPIQ